MKTGYDSKTSPFFFCPHSKSVNVALAVYSNPTVNPNYAKCENLPLTMKAQINAT